MNMVLKGFSSAISVFCPLNLAFSNFVSPYIPMIRNNSKINVYIIKIAKSRELKPDIRLLTEFATKRLTTDPIRLMMPWSIIV